MVEMYEISRSKILNLLATTLIWYTLNLMHLQLNGTFIYVSGRRLRYTCIKIQDDLSKSVVLQQQTLFSVVL